MKLLQIIMLLMLPLLIHAQETESCLSPESFKGIQVYDGIKVDLVRSDENKWCADSNTHLKDLSFTIESEILTIRKIRGTEFKQEPYIIISYKDLRSITGYNKSIIGTPNLIKSDSIYVTIKSGATFYGSFDVKYLEANVTEGCLFSAEGYANEQIVSVALKASFSAFGLEGLTGNVKSTSGGIAKVNITEKLNATASSGGYIGYKGSPKIESKTSLGGKIVNDID